MRNSDFFVCGLFALILLSGCVGVTNDNSKEESTLTTLTTTSIEECMLGQERCNDYCEEMCGSGSVDYCLFDEEECACKYGCIVETTSTSTTTTIGRVTCEVYCRMNGYVGGICRISPGECRTRGVKEVYKPMGNRYCPRNSPEDSCCCIFE